MYESRTYNALMREMLARLPEKVDRRENSFPFQMLAPPAWEMAELYRAMDQVTALAFLPTTSGEYLDDWGWTVGMRRNPATRAVYEFAWKGSEAPPAGERFFEQDGQRYYTLRRDGGGSLVLEAEEAGTASNYVPSGTKAVPVRTLRKLTQTTFGDLMEPGVDTEDDESFRERIHQKLAGPAENGNRQHYKTWCEEVTGVGRAKIVPLFAGENTVMAVLFDPDGHPCAKAVVDRVQQHVDPMTLGTTRMYKGEAVAVGDGLGDGVANIGAHFRAVAATELPVTVSFSVYLADGRTLAQAKAEAEKTIGEYLADVALHGMDGAIMVRIAEIGARLMEQDSIIDYEGLTLNGQPVNVRVDLSEAPVLEEVSVVAAV